MVDWDAVSQSGQSFAFVRATLGAQSADSQFARNWAHARTADLLRGAYHPVVFTAERIMRGSRSARSLQRLLQTDRKNHE